MKEREGKSVWPKSEDLPEWPENTKSRAAIAAGKGGKYLSAPFPPSLGEMALLGIATEDSSTSCHCGVPVNLELPTGVAHSPISAGNQTLAWFRYLPRPENQSPYTKSEPLPSRGGQLLLHEHVLPVTSQNMPHTLAWHTVPGIAEVPNTGSHTHQGGGAGAQLTRS